MSTWHRPHAESIPLAMRPHDADGISPEAHAVISGHGLSMGAVLGWADYYAAKEGVDFNRAPAQDFEAAPLGRNLVVKMGIRSPVLDVFRSEFIRAQRTRDYSAADGILSRGLTNGVIVDRSGCDMYGQWKQYAERLEGLNVALYWAANSATHLHRFIADLAELDNYLSGQWRKKGDKQDRVPMTVGASNLLATEPVARITYDMRAVRVWMHPVRYSPYPRRQDTIHERFGDEKDGRFAGEGEVHVHTRCPIPAPIHIKIRLLPACNRGRQDVIDRYGGVGDVE